VQLTQQSPNQAITIVHLLPHFARDGNGVVYVATDLACAQSAAGHSVSCIGGRSGAFADLLHEHSVETHTIPEFESGSFLNPRGLPALWRLLKTLRPDVVHAHTIASAVAAAVLQPLVGFGLVTSVHNGPRVKNFLLAVGDRIICVSAAVANGMRFLTAHEHKLRIVRNGPLGSPRWAQPVPEPADVALNHPAVLTVAGLHGHKGIKDLIVAFAMARRSIPDLSLYILGKGPQRSYLESLAVDLGCSDRIHFEGFIEDPRAYFRQADVFVLPSHREAFGSSLAEAREAGCAVIGTNVGGIPEVLEGGQCGILVPPNNPLALSRALVDLLGNEALLKFWQQRASSNLSWLYGIRALRETMVVYAELVARRSRRRTTSEPSPRHCTSCSKAN
jgi:glycosyltransferase involved in cell wall biosynthesis